MSTALFLAEEPASCLTLRFQGTGLAKGDHGWAVFHFSSRPCLSASSSRLSRGFILGFLRSHEQNGFSVFLFHNKLWESSESSKRHVDFFFLSFCSLVVGSRGGEDIWAFGGAFLIIIIIFLKIRFVMLRQAAHTIVTFLDMTSGLAPSVCPPSWETGPEASTYEIEMEKERGADKCILQLCP